MFGHPHDSAAMDPPASSLELQSPDTTMIDAYNEGASRRGSSVSPRSASPAALRSTSPLRQMASPVVAMSPVQKEDPSNTRLRNTLSYTRSLHPPPMARTRSLPIVNTMNRPGSSSPSHSPVRNSSPLRSPAATRMYSRRSLEDIYTPSPSHGFMDIESIAEDAELDLNQSRQGLDRDGQSSPFSFPSHSSTHPRPHRRRPVSPLHLTQPSNAYQPTASPTSTSFSSPSLGPVRYNEAYPSYPSNSFSLSGYSSSVPSTPTSFRSRSPSVSSLETIPDSPDAEDAAVEADNIAKLKAAADAADVEIARRSSGSSLDIPRTSWNNTAGTREKRKRWSVCGAERSGTFEMETIWED